MALSVNHPSARKFWSMNLSRSVSQLGFWQDSGLLKPKGDGDESACVIRMDELMTSQGQGKKSGYEVDYDLEGPLMIIPTSGDNPIKGKEKRLSLFSDKIQVNQDRVSVIDDGKFADGLVPYEYRERVKNRLSVQQWPTYTDERLIIKASGTIGDGTSWQTIDTNQPTTGARDKDGSPASDGNDLRAASSTRVVYGRGQASQAAMTTADAMSLDVVDIALLAAVRPEKNATLNRLLPPLIIGGRQTYVLLCDYVTLQAMNAATSGRFYDVQRAKIQGGMKDSALLDFATYVYRSPLGIDVMFVPHPKLVKFSAATTGSVQVVRNLLLGHSAMRVAYGRDGQDLPKYSWHEETDDRGNQLVVTSGTTVGIQKCAFNTTETGTTREDWAVIAIDTYGVWQ